jgi:site-specific DNA-methyltransferase (adenine-specific)
MIQTSSRDLAIEPANIIECNHNIFFQDAIKIKNLTESIDLVVTSPPYWSIKDYGNVDQIGYNDSLDDYMKKLVEIFKACVRLLKPNSKMCINIGDVFLRASTPPKKVYQIIPLHAKLINALIDAMPEEIVYLGSFQWEKVSRSNTSGGGQIMGSYPFPKSGYCFFNREYIATFRKMGAETKKTRPSEQFKNYSRLTLEEWRDYFKDVWKFSPADQKSHIAMFPEELPKRLIKMYSFVGDTILDPFLGSGTSSLAASNLGRNSIGYEIGFETIDGTPWKELIKNKITKENISMQFPLEDGNSDVLDIHNRYNFFEE